MRISALLWNCHNSVNGGQTSAYLNVAPMSIGDFLSNRTGTMPVFVQVCRLLVKPKKKEKKKKKREEKRKERKEKKKKKERERGSVNYNSFVAICTFHIAYFISC